MLNTQDYVKFQPTAANDKVPQPPANPTLRLTSQANSINANTLACNLRAIANALGVGVDPGQPQPAQPNETPLMASLMDTAGSLDQANSLLQKIMQHVGV